MRDNKYVVCRDEVYVGQVTKILDKIYRKSMDCSFSREGNLVVNAWMLYRSMLFVPTKNKMSNDLLYRTPNYPIFNITDDEYCLNLPEKSIVIQNACNLAPLLEYFGYSKDLTYKDIMEIRKTFFTKAFIKNNCELFGFKESQQMGRCSFEVIDESVLPSEYFYILDYLRDNTFRDILEGRATCQNAFTPHPEEGVVKKLTKKMHESMELK